MIKKTTRQGRTNNQKRKVTFGSTMVKKKPHTIRANLCPRSKVVEVSLITGRFVGNRTSFKSS